MVMTNVEAQRPSRAPVAETDKVVVRNLGPVDNSSTLKVKVE